jgi:hypothetical protein
MDTIGKPRPTHDEFGYYARWHVTHRLMMPQAREVVASPPVAPLAVKAPPSKVEPESESTPVKPLSRGWVAAILCALVFLYFVPPWDMRAFVTFASYRVDDAISAMRRATSSSTAVAARPAPGKPVASPAASAARRAPLPNSNALLAMPIGERTRDYFVKLMDENIDNCAPGHTEQERQMMTYLANAAIKKRLPPPPLADDLNKFHQKRLSDELQSLLARASWSANERQTGFGTIKTWIRRNYPADPVIDQTVRRLYASGCPRGFVAEAAYVAPSYADVRTIR